MSNVLMLNPEQNNSELNLNISKKLTCNSDNLDEKNKNRHIHDISFNAQLRKEIYYFKDDILKDINNTIEDLIIKMASNFREINEKIIKTDDKFKLIDNKINEIVEKTLKYDGYEIKFNDLNNYKIKNEKEMLSHKIIINDIKHEIKENFLEYDFILKKFKSSEDIVGDRRKFRNYPEMIKFLYQSIQQINSNKEKSNLEYKNYKSKLDSTISEFKSQTNSIITSMKNFTINNIKNSEGRLKGLFSLFDERLVEIRTETSKNSETLKKENEKFLNETIDEIKQELSKHINNEILNFNDLLKNLEKKLEENISDYNKEYNKRLQKLKSDFDNYKLNEDKRLEIMKIQKLKNENNINTMNKEEIINNRIITEKFRTQKYSYKTNSNINDENNFINNSNNNSIIDKLKKNFVFNFSDIKENEKKKEIKEEKIEENTNDNKLKLKYEKNTRQFSLIKNTSSNNDNNGAIYNIKKIIKYKNKINYPTNIKDNNIKEKEDPNNDVIKNINEIKDLMKFKSYKIKKEDNLPKTDRPDEKNRTTIHIHSCKTKDKPKRILSTNNIKIEKIKIDNENIDIENCIKKFESMEKSKLNHKINIYDIKFKPNKKYEAIKIKKEENKDLSRNLDDIIIINKKETKTKNKKEEYNYKNSKGEITNIIEMPPPEEAIFKNIFNID